MLVDYTFFQGGILDIEGAVLNIHTPSETNKAIVDSLQGFVMQYEPEYLEKLLGEKLYKEFSSYISNGGKTKEKRWDDLIAHLVMKYSDGDREISKSPIANYIYFHYLRHNHTQATITGVKADGDDGRLVSPERKMMFAWNDMVRMNIRLVRWLQGNNADYPDIATDFELMETINSFGL